MSDDKFGLSEKQDRQRLDDLEILRQLVNDGYSLTEWEEMAFPEMLAKLEKRGTLTEKQRDCVDRSAEKHSVAIRYENLVSSGKVQSRPDLPPLFYPSQLPKKPPGRR